MKYGKLFGRRLGSQRRVWRPRFKPSSTLTKVKLIPGKYVHPDGSTQPLGLLFSHFSPVTRKSTVCSSKWVLEGDIYVNSDQAKCVGCKTIENRRAGEPVPELSLSMKYAATATVLENYHLSPFGYDGKTPLGLDKDGKQKYSKVQCTGDEDCEGCKRNWKTVYGRRLVWEIPPTYAEKMRAVLESYRDTCGNCGSDGLEIVGAVCPNCGNDYPFNVSPDGEAVKCPSCGAVGTPEFDYSCPNCDDAKPVDLFSGVWQVKTVSSGKKWRELVVSRFYPGPVKKGALKKLKEAHGEYWKKLFEPFDLDSMYQPEPLGVQAKVLGVPNPYLKEEMTSMAEEVDSKSNSREAAAEDDDDGYEDDNVPF